MSNLREERRKPDDSAYVAAYIFMAFLVAVGALFGWLAHMWIMGGK